MKYFIYDPVSVTKKIAPSLSKKNSKLHITMLFFYNVI